MKRPWCLNHIPPKNVPAKKTFLFFCFFFSVFFQFRVLVKQANYLQIVIKSLEETTILSDGRKQREEINRVSR